MNNTPALEIPGAPRFTAAPSLPLPALPPRRPRTVFVAVSLLASLAVATGALYAWRTAGRESTDSAFIDGHRISVAAQVAGRVSEVLVDDNESVEAGRILLRLDPADYRVKLQQASAAQAQAESALAHARAQLPVVTSAARQASAQLKVAEANARQTASDLRRYRQLSDDAVPRIALNAVETRDTVAAAQVEAARSAADAAEAQIGSAQTAVAMAEAAIRAAAAQVAQARLALSYCEVKAPVAGWITRKSVEPGNYLQPGQPLLNLVTTDLFVTANFKETQLARLQPGQVVSLHVDTYPDIAFTGRVASRMAGTGSAFALLPPENATGNFVKVVQRVPVKIVFDPGELRRLPALALGLSVVATVDVNANPAPSHAVAQVGR